MLNSHRRHTAWGVVLVWCGLALTLLTTGAGSAAGSSTQSAVGPAYRPDHAYSIRATANSHYVAVEYDAPAGTRAMLRARATTVGRWEQFYVLQYSGHPEDYVFRSVAAQPGFGYVQTESTYPPHWAGLLRATGNENGRYGDAQTYRLVSLGSTDVAIYSFANHKYVSAELAYTGSDYGMLRARSNSISGWERFDIRDAGPAAVIPPALSAASG